jgi:hypothetical protein
MRRTRRTRKVMRKRPRSRGVSWFLGRGERARGCKWRCRAARGCSSGQGCVIEGIFVVVKLYISFKLAVSTKWGTCSQHHSCLQAVLRAARCSILSLNAERPA